MEPDIRGVLDVNYWKICPSEYQRAAEIRFAKIELDRSPFVDRHHARLHPIDDSNGHELAISSRACAGIQILFIYTSSTVLLCSSSANLHNTYTGWTLKERRDPQPHTRSDPRELPRCHDPAVYFLLHPKLIAESVIHYIVTILRVGTGYKRPCLSMFLP